MEIDIVNRKIGERIKNLRNRNGLTQQELADRTELTKGYISQLEHGIVSPSVVTLLDLIECLGTTPADFFRETKFEQVVYTEEGFFEKLDEEGNSIQWIVPTAQKNRMEPLLVRLEGHKKLSNDLPHEGEEFGYVIQGKIRLHLGGHIHTVKSGESFYYTADRDHYIENATSRPARFIWVSTPPSF
ncbi:MAG: helix-turn-helix transcriptional regulator [Lachnospiraceae bacterium]|nr:helix-turn-helix transcriptional regulator [Lachnospiraceae bacterium]